MCIYLLYVSFPFFDWVLFAITKAKMTIESWRVLRAKRFWVFCMYNVLSKIRWIYNLLSIIRWIYNLLFTGPVSDSCWGNVERIFLVWWLLTKDNISTFYDEYLGVRASFSMKLSVFGGYMLLTIRFVRLHSKVAQLCPGGNKTAFSHYGSLRASCNGLPFWYQFSEVPMF